MLQRIVEHFVVVDEYYVSRTDKICDYLEKLSGYKFWLHIYPDSPTILRTDPLDKTASPGILDGLARLEIIVLEEQEGRDAKFFSISAVDFLRLEARIQAKASNDLEKNKIERIVKLFKQAYSSETIEDFVIFDGFNHSASRPYWHIRTSKTYLKESIISDCDVLRQLKDNDLIEFDWKSYVVFSATNAQEVYYQIIIGVKNHEDLEGFLENKARKNQSLASLQRGLFWRNHVVVIPNPDDFDRTASDTDTDTDSESSCHSLELH